MKSIFLFLVLLFIQKVNAQEVSCDELQKFIEQKAYQKKSLHSYTLNSSWLYKVTAYDYDFKIYVVAEIKESEYSYSTRAYIFCGIPSQNWSNFIYGGYGDSDSYGKRFHKYILNYSCNCY